MGRIADTMDDVKVATSLDHQSTMACCMPLRRGRMFLEVPGILHPWIKLVAV